MLINLKIRQNIKKKKRKKEPLYIQSVNVLFSMPSKTNGFLMLWGGTEREQRVVMDSNLFLIFFHTDIYECAVINYLEFLGDTLNGYQTLNIHEIDNAIHCTWKRWSKHC